MIKSTNILIASSVQLLSHVQLFATPWTVALQASLSITNYRSLLKLTSTELVIPSNHLILCCPLLWAFNIPLHQGLFQWVSCSCKVAKVLQFQLQHLFFQWIFRKCWFPLGFDWFDLPEVREISRSLVQHCSLKASVLQHSAFFIVHSHIHTWLLEKP